MTQALEHLQFPGESPTYRQARNGLLDAEIELRRQVERVAAQRRALPRGGRLREDYRFLGKKGPVTLSQLIPAGAGTLAVYSFMFGPERERPCPGCTHFLDGLDGQVRHIDQRLGFVVVAKSPLPRILALAEERGWRGLHLYSTDGSSYDRDYFGDTGGLPRGVRVQQELGQEREWDMPMLNVFKRDADGIFHTWGSELLYAPAEPGQDYRHNDLLDPLWNMLDLTPEGRGEFEPKLDYPEGSARLRS